MLNSQTNSDDRRFLYELDAIISNANDGHFKETLDLLTHFYNEANNQKLIDIRVIEFVSKTLTQLLSNQERRTQSRNIEIKQAVDSRLLGTKNLGRRRKSMTSVTLDVSNDFSITRDGVQGIYNKPLSTLGKLNRSLTDKTQPRPKLLKDVAIEVHSIISDLIKRTDKGERLRSRLNLKGFGYWNRPTAEHEEIFQDIQQHVDMGKTITKARELVAKKLGLKSATVTKIDQRKRKSVQMDIQELTQILLVSGTPIMDVETFIANMFDMEVAEIKN